MTVTVSRQRQAQKHTVILQVTNKNFKGDDHHKPGNGPFYTQTTILVTQGLNKSQNYKHNSC